MSANIILCETGYYRSACVECQRRKQKCNREWPCDSCRRRKVPDGCRYNDTNLPGENGSQDVIDEKSPRQHEKRFTRTKEEGNGDNFVLEAIADRAFASMGLDRSEKNDAPVSQKEDMVSVDSSVQLEKVLKLLPQRRTMDAIMQAFLTDVNYHYYIIHPTSLLKDYNIWWSLRTTDSPVSLQYTLLLAMVNAGTLQHVGNELQNRLEAEFGESTDSFSDRLHDATRELASVVPVGHYHMLNVQRLLHSCYWYKAEARFVEAWHVLSQAILEARELHLHIEMPDGAISDYEREMRRRLWCILDTWDWQISSGLGRPKLINRQQCNVALPDLLLESYNPSPLLHMKLQSRLTRQLANRFNAPKNITSPEDIQEYKGMIVDWVSSFPPEYDFYSPDTSRDEVHPWIVPHRFYIYTMACLLILNPVRTYMVKSYTWESPPEELEVRNIGVFYSLVLIQTLRRWVDRISSRDGRLHFIIFSIFDTAAILCTAVLKDGAKTLPRRGEILESIERSNIMLDSLICISKTAKTSRDILNRLSRKLPRNSPRATPSTAGRHDERRKRAKFTTSSPSAPHQSPITQNPASASAPALAPVSVGIPGPAPQVPTQRTISPSNGSHQENQAPSHYAPNAEFQPTNPTSVESFTPHSNPYFPSPSPVRSLQAGTSPAHLQSPPMMPNGMPAMPVDTTAELLVPQSFSNHIGVEVPAVATFWNAPRPPTLAVAQPVAPIPQVTNGASYMMMTDAHGNVAGIPQPNFMPSHTTYSFPTMSEPVAELDLANLTEADVGGLAPLWGWHSANLDISILRSDDTDYSRDEPRI